MYKTKMAKVPVQLYEDVNRIAQKLDVPNTKAFMIQQKLLRFEWEGERVKKKGRGKRAEYILRVRL